MDARRVAVVGGGLAGLSAALELKEYGCRVEVFERSRLLGGRATSFEIDGCEVDNGQHVFLACCTEFVRFAERVGMADRLHLQRRFDALLLSRDGVTSRLRAAPLPAPLHLLASFGRYRHLRLGGKLRVARALASALFARGDSGGTFDSWLASHGQDVRTRRAFWDPFFIPALNAPLEQASGADALFVLSTAFLGGAGAARFGFSTEPLAHFAEAAALRVDAMHRSTAVLGVELASEPGARVRLRLAGDRAALFDAVVLAVPPRAVAKLLGDPQRFGVIGLDAYTPYPILDVHLWHDRGCLGFEFAALLESPLQWVFEKEPGYLCCSVSAAGEYLTLPAADLKRLVWEELLAFFPALRGAAPVRAAVTRNPEATFLPRPGMRRTSQRTAYPEIAIAGSWTDTGWPDTMESAVRSGTAAADVLRGALGSMTGTEARTVA
ncbi:MAG: hydroxysqualene dehydroxylase HpnE [Vulcanimicrobiaceae bacterium]